MAAPGLVHVHAQLHFVAVVAQGVEAAFVAAVHGVGLVGAALGVDGAEAVGEFAGVGGLLWGELVSYLGDW